MTSILTYYTVLVYVFIHFSEEIVSKLYQSIYWTDTIFKFKTRIKSIQKILAVFQYPHLIEARHRKQWLIWALMKKLSIAQFYVHLTYWNTSYDKEEYLADHNSLISSLNTLPNKEHDDFSSLYWITKLHKNPYTEKNTSSASPFQLL
jgi:hypothetical protein